MNENPLEGAAPGAGDGLENENPPALDAGAALAAVGVLAFGALNENPPEGAVVVVASPLLSSSLQVQQKHQR